MSNSLGRDRQPSGVDHDVDSRAVEAGGRDPLVTGPTRGDGSALKHSDLSTLSRDSPSYKSLNETSTNNRF